MGEDVWVAVIAGGSLVMSTAIAGLLAIVLAKVNSTKTDVAAVKTDVGEVKTDVGHATVQAAAANEAAVAARDNSKPLANGYADESRSAWARIEGKVDTIGQALMQHLQDHSQSDLTHPPRERQP